ncbi:ypc1-alkaline ceramidase [Malassezia pachydermatis]|uniref:Ypc1-alkaline ceramidase n=1 Tax=Malassezia pachydermatis TaxID=77020 RepID=A0A0M8MUM1_9BASI|nr:ypc1-alkaline ceramidase [Malassezia pachydermatis]KOS13931.1 ypc1-alkaline ceramidase [Malassezia pachydermatis]
MSWLPHTEPMAEGYWGPVTSTLLWCERKYEWTKYMAEPVNSLTNLLFLFLSGYGMYRVASEQLSARFYLCAAGIGIVGMGSFLFHMTMKYEAQLLDELPMIYASSFISWSLLDQTMFYGQTLPRRILPVIVLAVDAWITVTYVTNGNPIFHQAAYASIMVISISHAIYIMMSSKSPLNLSDAARARRQEARYSERTGTILFLVGFTIWNLDNIFCGHLRAMREVVGYPLAILLEGHGWWHIFTGYGAYHLLIATEAIVMSEL